jgi:hypothetical protein
MHSLTPVAYQFSSSARIAQSGGGPQSAESADFASHLQVEIACVKRGHAMHLDLEIGARRAMVDPLGNVTTRRLPCDALAHELFRVSTRPYIESVVDPSATAVSQSPESPK